MTESASSATSPPPPPLLSLPILFVAGFCLLFSGYGLAGRIYASLFMPSVRLLFSRIDLTAAIWLVPQILDAATVVAAIALLRLHRWGRALLEGVIWIKITFLAIQLTFILYKSSFVSSYLFLILRQIVPMAYFLLLIWVLRQKNVREALIRR